MSSILSLVGLIFIIVALTLGKKRHMVYRYSMLVCIVTSFALCWYYILTASGGLLFFLNVVLVAVASGALIIGEKQNRGMDSGNEESK